MYMYMYMYVHVHFGKWMHYMDSEGWGDTPEPFPPPPKYYSKTASSPAAATICRDPHFNEISKFLSIYLHACDGPKSWYIYITSMP